MRGAVIAALLLLATSSAAALAEEADAALPVEAVMSELAKVRAAQAHYTELRYMAMLTQPIQTTGTMRYVAPDELERDTILPKPTRLIVRGQEVTVEEEPGKSRVVSLDEAPEIAAIIESIRGTLAGDQAALERYYSLSMRGTLADWQLMLTPKSWRMRHIVESIQLSGQDGEVRTIETLEHNGDRTVMTVTKDSP
jgi:outer membrane lipoprotein-sorting protein